MATLTLVKEKREERDQNFALYQLYEIGDYKVSVATYTFKNCDSFKSITVTQNNDVEFLPHIYFEREPGEDYGKFKIQTTSYGAMDVEQIKKIIKGYEEALMIVDALQNSVLNEK